MTALVMLLLMSLLAGSMLGKVTLQEKISGNLRAQLRTYEVASSAAKRQWSWDGIINDITGSETALDERERNYETDYADVDGDGTTDMTMPVTVSICYAGEASGAGLGLDANISANNQAAAYHQFRVASEVQLPSHNATSRVELGGFMVLPKVGRSATCTF